MKSTLLLSPICLFTVLVAGVAWTQTSDRLNISSPLPVAETALDMSQFSQLLESEDWREADFEAFRLLVESASQDDSGGLGVEKVESMPCIYLREIDQKWVEASNGQYGFSVQVQAWQDVGSPISTTDQQWREYSTRSGWFDLDERTWNFSNTQNRGHYPLRPYRAAWEPRGGEQQEEWLFAWLIRAASCGL